MQRVIVLESWELMEIPRKDLLMSVPDCRRLMGGTILTPGSDAEA